MKQATRERIRRQALEAAGTHVIQVSCITCRQVLLHGSQLDLERSLSGHRVRVHHAITPEQVRRMALKERTDYERGERRVTPLRLLPNRRNFLNTAAIADMIAMSPRKARAIAS